VPESYRINEFWIARRVRQSRSRKQTGLSPSGRFLNRSFDDEYHTLMSSRQFLKPGPKTRSERQLVLSKIVLSGPNLVLSV
jgi:hypothetical protein